MPKSSLSSAQTDTNPFSSEFILLSPHCDGQPRLSSNKKQSPEERKAVLGRREHLAMFLSPIHRGGTQHCEQESKSLEVFKSGCDSVDNLQLINVFQSPVPKCLK